MTWLGVLNFVVLQWFGMRLARVYAIRLVDRQITNAWVAPGGSIERAGERVQSASSAGSSRSPAGGPSTAGSVER